MLAYSDINFQALGNGEAKVAGELAVQPSELGLTEESLRAARFNTPAIHNHAASESRRLIWVHFSKTGDAQQIAREIRAILDQNELSGGNLAFPSSYNS
jgi:hypothetical protein